MQHECKNVWRSTFIHRPSELVSSRIRWLVDLTIFTQNLIIYIPLASQVKSVNVLFVFLSFLVRQRCLCSLPPFKPSGTEPDRLHLKSCTRCHWRQRRASFALWNRRYLFDDSRKTLTKNINEFQLSLVLKAMRCTELFQLCLSFLFCPKSLVGQPRWSSGPPKSPVLRGPRDLRRVQRLRSCLYETSDCRWPSACSSDRTRSLFCFPFFF